VPTRTQVTSERVTCLLEFVCDCGDEDAQVANRLGRLCKT
jgi:hypothetical protein